MLTQTEAYELAAVSSNMDNSVAAWIVLRVEGNPWGATFLIFSTDPASPEDALIWFYYADLHWSIPSSPRRDILLAFDERASKLTPGLPLLEAADEDLRRRIGVESVSREEVLETVLLSVRQAIP